MIYGKDKVLDAIIQARVALLFDSPFFGNMATRLKLLDASKWCPTAATDGRHFFFNRKFIESLDPQELKFLFAHEVLHSCFDHFGRRGNRIPEYWNAANDYIVNYTLCKQNIGKMPKNGLHSNEFTDEMTSEEVYNKLLKQYPPTEIEIKAGESKKSGKDSDKGSGKPGKKSALTTLDVHLDLGKDSDKNQKSNQDGNSVFDRDKGWKDPDGNPDPGNDIGVEYSDEPPTISEEGLNNIRNELRAVMIGAVQSNQGNAPAGITRLIDDITKPTLNWKEILQMQIQSHYKDDYTFMRINKKSWTTGCILPGSNYGNRLSIAVSIDTSGSISDMMVKEFLAEVKSIMECFNDYEVHIWCIDAKVYQDTYKIFTPENVDELMDYQARGGGGNDFPANWRFMKDIDLCPEIFLVMSDGYPCGSWGDPNYCETIFVIKNQWDKTIKVPFGLTLYMDDVSPD